MYTLLPSFFRKLVVVEAPELGDVYHIPSLALFLRDSGCFFPEIANGPFSTWWQVDPVFFFNFRANPEIIDCVRGRYTMRNTGSFSLG